MSFLRGPNSQAQVPMYTGLQVQTSSGAVPIPIVYGETKIAPNYVWANGFEVHGSTGGGKGGLFAPPATSYTYTSSIIMGLCEGPAGFGAIWNGNDATDLAGLGLAFFEGDTSQQAPGFIQSLYPAQALAYRGTAYFVGENYDLGSSATVNSLSVEMFGTLAKSGWNNLDADPGLCIWDFLTNVQYGVGFPQASVKFSSLVGSNGGASVQTYCYASGLAISPALVNQESADSILTRWLQLINVAAFWSEGLLKFAPYGDTPVTGNVFTGASVVFGTDQANQQFANVTPGSVAATWTFNPDVTPVYNLGDDDFLHADDEDPVKVVRSDPFKAYNEVQLEIYQRTNYYDATPITVFDQSAIDKYLLRIAPMITAHEICDSATAQTAAQLILQRGLYIRNTYQFKLSWEYGLLEPMDLVTLTDPAIGLNNTAVRITAIEEDDEGKLAITAEEFPNGVATSVAYPVQQKSSSAIARNTPASSVNTPLIFEPPYELAGELAVWGAVSGQTFGTWGGANVFASTDGVNYKSIGTIDGPANMGVTTADLPAVSTALRPPTVDSVHPLAVDLSSSGGQLQPSSATDMLAGSSACFIQGDGGGEVVSYQNATLTAANQYSLTNLQRGAFDSIIADHPAGSSFARLDNQIFKLPYQSSQIGQTIYFKFQSFNTLGGGTQDLSDCAAYPYVITGSPLAAPVEEPVNLYTNFTDGFQKLYWDEVTDFRGNVRYKILIGPSPTGAQQCGDVAHPPFNLPGTGTFYVQAYVTPLPNLVVSSPISGGLTIAGNMIVANALDEFNQQAENWPGTRVNFFVDGTSPDEILNLQNAANIDYGLASAALTASEDFGLASDDLIVVIDLGLASI